MSATSRADIVIIGGGVSGTLFARALARRGLRSTLIDPASRPGFGLACATTLPEHLLNVRAGNMSADPDRPTHFVDWLRCHGHPEATAADFVSRMLYGDYLRALFAEARPDHRRDRAIRLRPEGAGWGVSFASGDALSARTIVLATGNFCPQPLPGLPDDVAGSSRWHPDPWRADYTTIAPSASVALLGTGLTAIDAILSLRAAGHVGPIHALSRRALLPEAHLAAASQHLPPVITPAAPGDTSPHVSALLRMFRVALAAGVPWREAIDSLRPVANALWSAAAEHDRARFRRHLQRRWDVARHRIPPAIAARVAALRAAGTLHLVRGHVTAATLAADGLIVEADGPERRIRMAVDHAINCTGPNLRYAGVGEPLFDGMLADGIARPGRGGLAFAVTPDGQLLGAGGIAQPGLFALGSARLGALFESIAVPDIRNQAYELAARF